MAAFADFRHEFDIREDGEVPEGWTLATAAEVRANLDALKDLLSSSERNWYICRLADGKLHGAAREFDIEEGEVREKLGHMVVTRLTDFQVVTNGECPKGWKLCSCAQVTKNMDTVKGLFNATDSYACKVADGRVNVASGNCSVEAGGCWFGWFHRQDHMIITKDQKPQQILKLAKCGEIPAGWRLVSCKEASDNLHQVKSLLGPDKAAYVCQSSDGLIYGAGQNYKVDPGEHAYKLSYMILAKVPEFKVEAFAAVPPDGWRLATVAEVGRDLDALKRHFRAGMEWHICQLQDGRVHGPGNEFQLEEGLTKDKLGHMVLIKEDED